MASLEVVWRLLALTTGQEALQDTPPALFGQGPCLLPAAGARKRLYQLPLSHQLRHRMNWCPGWMRLMLQQVRRVAA